MNCVFYVSMVKFRFRLRVKVRLKRLLQLKQNNAKQVQKKSKTICLGFVSALRTCETKR